MATPFDKGTGESSISNIRDTVMPVFAFLGRAFDAGNGTASNAAISEMTAPGAAAQSTVANTFDYPNPFAINA